MATPRKVFINLAVGDLEKSKAFFAALGFGFHLKCTNDEAACMVLGEDGNVMLLTESTFKRFTQLPLADPRRQTECIVSLTCETRAEVDEMFGKAIAAGASQAMDAQDHGFMYCRGFYDLDGHHWEFFWMDPASLQ
ncbi:MAG: hypothetical protein JNM66_02080 [Bryobacterales bacterium]|nr:hypothetical protein [Bryobacterales bacterium]